MLEQARCTLCELGVRQVECVGEADQEIASAAALAAAAEGGKGRAGTYVLGGDTDFLLFRGCRTVRFEHLRFKFRSAPSSSHGRPNDDAAVEVVEAVVLSRRRARRLEKCRTPTILPR